jgi:hypothetical protein
MNYKNESFYESLIQGPLVFLIYNLTLLKAESAGLIFNLCEKGIFMYVYIRECY